MYVAKLYCLFTIYKKLHSLTVGLPYATQRACRMTCHGRTYALDNCALHACVPACVAWLQPTRFLSYHPYTPESPSRTLEKNIINGMIAKKLLAGPFLLPSSLRPINRLFVKNLLIIYRIILMMCAKFLFSGNVCMFAVYSYTCSKIKLR